MDFSTLLLVLFSFILTCIIFLASNSKPRKSGKLPPGPRPLPIIGNILDIRGIAYRSLAKLSQTYGPIMYLKMGYTETVVFSSPETAKLVLQKYDQSLSGRIVPIALKSIDLDKISMGWLPAEDQWRKLRKVWKEQMFSLQRLDASKGLRGENLRKLCEYLDQCSIKGQVVDLAEALFTTSLNMMSSTLFSIDFADIGSDSSHEFKDVLSNVMKCIGTPSFADYFPILKYADLQGISRRTKYYVGKFGEILDKVIEERLASRDTSEKNDSIEALLGLHRKPVPELSRIDIKYLLMDSFLGGTDSTPSAVQWAMALLFGNPTKMLKVKTELSDVIGSQHGMIQESDISKLPYLQAVVKETMRLYPLGPLLVPHKAMVDVEINGYIIPQNAQILVNSWALGRDPSVWSEPDAFIPERFLNFKNKYFEFIPFSAGRRTCPGMPLANRLVPTLMATLLHNYDWELEEGLKPEDIDMSEQFATVLHKVIPLKAIPIRK